MQPAIPIWVTVALAFLAPVAALVGVVVGAVMNRRTTKLQLDAARERDRELWTREDRHRFAEQKRVLYAEYLAVTELVVDALSNTFNLFAPISHLNKDEKRERKTELRKWAEDLNAPLNSNGCFVKLKEFTHQLDFVSPEPIRLLIQDFDKAAHNASLQAELADCSLEIWHETSDKLYGKSEKIRNAMREDLSLAPE